MAASRFVIPSSQAPSHSAPTNVGQVDPNSMRSMLMLESVSHMMTETDWPYRAASIELTSQGDEVGAYRLFGANNPNSIWDVFERKIDISIMNPSAILRMADRGVGLFSEPMQVALIAVMPHYDQLGFAVSNSSGLTFVDRDPRKAVSVTAVRAWFSRCLHNHFGGAGLEVTWLQLRRHPVLGRVGILRSVHSIRVIPKSIVTN